MVGFKKFPTAVAHLASYLTDLTSPGLTISKIGFAAAATAAVVPFLIFLAGGEPVSAWNWVIPAGLILLIEGYRLQELAITDEIDREMARHEADIAGWEV